MATKLTYKKILVPHDGSKPSDRALEAAIPICRETGAELVLLHITNEVLIPSSTTNLGYSKITGDRLTAETLSKEIYQQLKNEAEKMLDKRKESCRRSGVSVQIRIMPGYAPEKILEFARQEDVSVIFMGSTGLTGISKIAAIGSVARKVADAAKCPVVLVK
jgi:nucleotide-binding universal stress UspA family protein